MGQSDLICGIWVGILFSTTNLVQLKMSGNFPVLTIFSRLLFISYGSSSSLKFSRECGIEAQPMAFSVFTVDIIIFLT
jgi:hypothetical protein